MPPVLSVRGVRKTFGATAALRDVDLDVAQGTIHGLVGGNGSGKSTLIKILAGVYEADTGTISVRGESHDARRLTPAWAKDVGLRFVHQDLGLFADLTIAENMVLGRGYERAAGGRIDWRAVRARATALLEQFSIAAQPNQMLRELSQAERTLVAIARALQDEEQATDSTLILDEPTSCLANNEVERLLSGLRRCADAGQAIILVSHRLSDIIRVADVASVLKDGVRVATLARDEIAEDRLVELISGHVPMPEHGAPQRTGAASERPLLRVARLTSGRLRRLSLETYAGEIVGIAGMLGSGRSTMLRAIFGAARVEAGTIEVDGGPLRVGDITSAISAGVAYVPENRLQDAAFLDQSVRHNLSIADLGSYWSGLRLRRRAEARDARRDIDRYRIVAGDDSQPFSTLSGGNQQKTVLARWLRLRPRVLLLDEPTQSVDVRARAEIHSLMAEAASEGATILVVSSDFDELALVCDRVLVFRLGQIAGEVPRSQLTEDVLTSLAARPAPVVPIPA